MQPQTTQAARGVSSLPPTFEPGGSIACPSTTTCYDVGYDTDSNQDAFITTTDSGTTWTEGNISGSTFFGSPIACPSTSVCYLPVFVTAYPFEGFRMLATTNAGSTWVSQSLPKHTGNLTSLSCPSVSICYGVGQTMVGGGFTGTGDIVVTTDSGTVWANQLIPSGTGDLYSVDCSSTTICFAEGTPAGSSGAVVLEGNALSVTTTSLPSGTIGTPYSASLAATGGDPPYTWKLAPGSPRMPRGLRINKASGTITGTPSKASASSTFTVEVLDAKAKPPVQNAATATLTIVIAPVAGSNVDHVGGLTSLTGHRKLRHQS